GQPPANGDRGSSPARDQLSPSQVAWYQKGARGPLFSGLDLASEAAGNLLPGSFVLVPQFGHGVCHRLLLSDATNTLAGAPDIPPGLALAAASGTKAHLALVREGQVVGIQPGLFDAAAQVGAVDAGK